MGGLKGVPEFRRASFWARRFADLSLLTDVLRSSVSILQLSWYSEHTCCASAVWYLSHILKGLRMELKQRQLNYTMHAMVKY